MLSFPRAGENFDAPPLAEGAISLWRPTIPDFPRQSEDG
jgi:hypothetical protein